MDQQNSESKLPLEPGGRPKSAAVRLSVMMFMQYAIWGIWLPILANYLGAPLDAGGLGFSGAQIGWILGLAGSIGAIAGPLGGQLADRVLNAERALALLVLLGGTVKFVTAYVTDYPTFLALSVLYSVFYMPTLALTNSVAFANLSDPERKFPPVRSLGTIGWIASANLFPLIWLTHPDPAVNTARVADAMIVSGILSGLYAVYCLLVLPKTPPNPNRQRPLAFVEAFKLLRVRAFLVTTGAALVIAMIHQCYFIRTGPFLESRVGFELKWVGPVMSVGQVSEIVFLAILGVFIRTLGYKGVLMLGAASFAVRYFIFSLGSPQTQWLMVLAMTLHGLNYGCFFAGSFLLVERVAPPDVRHSAQTVFGMVILGLGPVLAGVYNQHFDPPVIDGVRQAVNYAYFWQVQSALAVAALAVLAIGFPKRVPADQTP